MFTFVFILLWLALGIGLDRLSREYFAQVYECEFRENAKWDYLNAAITGPLVIVEMFTIAVMYLQFKATGLYKKKKS